MARYPEREGIVALLEPFIDTVVVCTMTALVIVITGCYSGEAFLELNAGVADTAAVQATAAEIDAMSAAANGAGLTSVAMGQALSFFPYVLSVAVLLFAFSTMISWSYYGERCWGIELPCSSCP